MLDLARKMPGSFNCGEELKQNTLDSAVDLGVLPIGNRLQIIYTTDVTRQICILERKSDPKYLPFVSRCSQSLR
jgi:hypothetical protein